jgi:hypothetical protein
MFSSLWGAALLVSAAGFAELGLRTDPQSWNAIARSLGIDGAEAPLSIMLAATLLFLGNRYLSILHSWSTTYMVLFSPLFAEERRQHPRRYVAIPALLASLAFALGFIIAGWPPYPIEARFQPGLWAFGLYITLFWVGHFWHFGNQDFGVLTLYRAKAGQTDPIDRKLDKLYTASMMFVIQPIVYLSIVKTTAFSEFVHITIPLDASIFDIAARVGLGTACLLSAGMIGRELARENRSAPKLLYYLVIFLHPVLIFGAVWAKQPTIAFLYIMAYLWSHWFIAVGLVCRINTRYYQSRGASPGRSLARHAMVLGSIALLVWLATYSYTEYGLFNTDGFAYKKILAGIGPAQRVVIGLVLGFYLTEQLVHYYCDRRLFRFRDPGVRARVAPLLL